jgi:hypothetical protein
VVIVSDEPRPQVKPLDPPMIPFAVVGIVVWAVVALIFLALHGTLTAHGHGSWTRIAVAGFIWGFPGLATMVVHDRNRKRRRASDSFKTGASSSA